MNPRVRRNACWLGIVLGAGLLTGCVERKYVLTTDPPGALVFENNRPIGQAPADGTFVYYGYYDFTLVADGYETLKVRERIRAPWYEWFPLDFVTENLIPWKIQDERRFHYVLQPTQMPNVQDVGNRAQEFRNRGQAIGREGP
jgi:hypothetical protein